MKRLLPLLLVLACTLPSFAVDPLAVEDLGVPVRTMRRAGDFLVPKPDGAGWWFITSYNPMSRSTLKNQLFIVDLNTKEYRIEYGPTGGGLVYGWFNKGFTAPDGTFYISQYGSVGVHIFDPEDGSMAYVPFEAVTDRVMVLPWRYDEEANTLFGGTASGRAYLVSFDLETRQWRNYGVPDGPMPAPRYVWSLAVGDDYIYSGMGKNPWHLIATHRETGEHTRLLPHMQMEYLSVGGRDPVTASVKVRPDPEKKDTVTKLFKLEGKTAVPYAPPKAAPKPRAKPTPRPELVTTLARPTSEGTAQVWFKLPGAEWDHVDLAGIQTTPWRFVDLLALDDGRLLGAPGGYEDIFTFDPKTDTTAILGKATMSMGEMETVGGTVYMAGYPGTIIHEYDPAKPWTYFTTTPEKQEPPLESPESNPRFCARLGDICKTHHARGTAVGADGFIYVGGHAERLHVGGGLMWWDPVNRKAGGIREPFELQDCADICAARAGKLIVYSSRPVSDPRKEKPTPETAKLFVLDTATKEIVTELTPLPGARSCGPIVAIGDTVCGVAHAGGKHTFYAVDLAAGKVLHTADVPARVGELVLGPDGKIYAFVGDVLNRIDPKTYAFTPLGSVEKAGRMTFLGPDLYLTGTHLRRIKHVTALGAPE